MCLLFCVADDGGERAFVGLCRVNAPHGFGTIDTHFLPFVFTPV